MMKRFGILLALASACSTMARADEPIISIGFTDMSCGAWSESAGNRVARAQYVSWFRGFVSGHNYYNRDRQISDQRWPSESTLALYVDKWCHDNPLKAFPGAAIQLVKELVPPPR